MAYRSDMASRVSLLFISFIFGAEVFDSMHLCLQLFLLAIIECLFAEKFRVMTFNIWNSGSHVQNGLQKVAKHILLVDPDVVALQEVQRQDVLPVILSNLGKSWTGITGEESYPDVAILTKHEILAQTQIETNRSIGVRIALQSGHLVNFVCVHLDYKSFGPYAANNKMVKTVQQILVGEEPMNREGRAQNMEEILAHTKIRQWLNKSDVVPVVLTGDFNSPSHLDWTNETKDDHGDWVVEWPATKLAEEMGLVDSFRVLHTNITEVPGYTWSTVNKFMSEWEYQIPEPQDRIDFIFYKGNLFPVESFLYAGAEQIKPMPFHASNDYPSDHYALITEFEFPYTPDCHLC
ncbi:hypothetical protein OESDEN_20481 [Oesophagostomum dentatum]|uniref:Endonuclease/exonuclease/phosphatase domain-containing protein n=1 Tax=Oesophagostomum dentatum TaxID=61180 RepID=A0A0B1S4J3_OESDE|nr:hypothetical protein OESDEN_20481 [Oesophagostomum dentatum]